MWCAREELWFWIFLNIAIVVGKASQRHSWMKWMSRSTHSTSRRQCWLLKSIQSIGMQHAAWTSCLKSLNFPLDAIIPQELKRRSVIISPLSVLMRSNGFSRSIRYVHPKATQHLITPQIHHKVHLFTIESKFRTVILLFFMWHKSHKRSTTILNLGSEMTKGCTLWHNYV